MPGALAVAGALGWLFFALGAIDLALTWFPPFFGNAEWEFGSFSASLNNMPVVVLGLGLGVMVGLATGRRIRLWVSGGASGALAVLVLGGMVLYLLDIPLALRAATDPVIGLGLKKAVAKTLSQAVLYEVTFVGLALMAWRAVRTGGSGSTRSEPAPERGK